MNNKGFSKVVSFSHSFISDAFPSFLTGAQKVVLALSVKNLIYDISNELRYLFDEELFLIENFIRPLVDDEANITKYIMKSENDGSQLNSNALDEIIAVNMQLSRQLRKFHACTFITTIAKTGRIETERLNRYKLLTLLCSIRLAKIGDHDSSIHDSLNEFRQLALGRRDNLIAFLPDAIQENFNSVIEQLKDQMSKEVLDGSTKKKLSHYFVLFNHALNFRSGIKRGVGKYCVQEASTGLILNQNVDSGYDIYKIKYDEKLEQKNIWSQCDIEDTNTTPEKVSTFIVFDKLNNESIEKDQRYIKAKFATDSIIFSNQSLNCDIKILTDYEVRSLVNYIFDVLSHKEENFISAADLLFSLLPGRSNYNNVRSPYIYDKAKKGWKLAVRHDVATKKQKNEVRHLITPVSDSVEWFLPRVISELLPTKHTPLEVEERKKYLKAINRKIGTQLNISQIDSYFSHFCHQQAVDGVLIEIIGGIYQNPGGPYTNSKQTKIADVCNHYCEHVFYNNSFELALSENNETECNTSIGSPLLLKDDAIIRVNKIHIRQIMHLNKNARENMIRLHNEYVFYIYRMITMASFYRAVSGVGGTLKDINFKSGQYWISDKESRGRSSARLIVLPKMVINQIQLFLNYLEEFKYITKIRMPDVVKRINTILSKDAHFLFFIGENGVIEVSPKTITPYMENQFSLKLNWNRHHLRTKLIAMGLAPALIAGYMGHDEMGQECFGRYSAASHADSQSISEKIEAILHELQFEVISL